MTNTTHAHLEGVQYHGYLWGTIHALNAIGRAGDESLFREVATRVPIADLINAAGDEPDNPIWHYLKQYSYVPLESTP